MTWNCFVCKCVLGYESFPRKSSGNTELLITGLLCWSGISWKLSTQQNNLLDKDSEQSLLTSHSLIRVFIVYAKTPSVLSTLLRTGRKIRPGLVEVQARWHLHWRATTCDFQQCGMWSLIRAFTGGLIISMPVKLLTEYNMEFLSLREGCIGSSEYIHVKMPHCWKSHVAAKFSLCFGLFTLLLFINPFWTNGVDTVNSG